MVSPLHNVMSRNMGQKQKQCLQCLHVCFILENNPNEDLCSDWLKIMYSI